MIGLLGLKLPRWRTSMLRGSSWRCGELLSNVVRFQSTKGRTKSNVKFWAPEEDELIIKHFNSDKPRDEISELVPGRSLSAVRSRAYKTLSAKGLISIKSPKAFTSEEDDKIKQLAAQGVRFSAMMHHLPGRTTRAVRNHLQALQKRRKSYSKHGVPFTPLEESKLLDLRENKRLSWIKVAQQMSGRTPKQLSNRYMMMRPPSARVNVPSEQWPSDADRLELTSLRESGLTYKAIAEKLGNISEKTAQRRMSQMQRATPQVKRGTARWTKQEDEKLLDLRQDGQSWQQISKAIDSRSLEGIKQRWNLLKEKGVAAAKVEANE